MSFLSSFFDNIFPPRCVGCKTSGIILCTSCIQHMRTLRPRHSEHIIAPLPYQDPIVKRSIKALKFKRTRDIARSLGNILHESTLDTLSDIRELSPGASITIIPIPLSKKRLSERGFNQAEDLARAFATNDASYSVDCSIVEKLKHTPAQSSLHLKRQRLENIKGVFTVKNPERIARKTVILLDDISTTGATIEEAKRVLKQAGARKVICMALAH